MTCCTLLAATLLLCFHFKNFVFSDGIIKVVALGTGTSSLGFNQTCSEGRLVHDSHAEVIARRSFSRFFSFVGLLEYFRQTSEHWLITKIT